MTSKESDVSERAVELLARLHEIMGNQPAAFTLRRVGVVGTVFERQHAAILATLSPPLPSPPGRVEIKVGDPDYERFNLTVSDEARERLAQKPSAVPVDCVVGARRREALAPLIATVERRRDLSDAATVEVHMADLRRAVAALSALSPLEDRRE